jgi:MFS family permease
MIFSLAFLLALLANFLFWINLQALYPALPLYSASLGGSPADNGLATFAAAGAAVLARPFIGTLADRWGRKPVMLLGGVIWIATPILYSVSRNVPALIGVRALSGVGIATFTTGFQALIADLAPPERRGEVFGMGGNSMALASLIGPLIGDWLMSQRGFGATFVLAAIAGALSVAATLVIREPRREIKQIANAAPLSGLLATLAYRNIRAGILAVSPLGMAFGAMVTFWPLVAQENHLGTTGAFYSVYALGMLTMQVLAGRLSDRIGRTRVMLPGLLLAGAAFGLIPQAHSDVASLLVAFGCGAGLGIARTAMDALVLDGVPAALRGTAVAAEFTINDLWIGLGSVLTGALAGSGGFSTAYGVSGAACILVAIALAIMNRTSHEAVKRQISDGG